MKLAEQNPAKEIVFFGVGFETTAPATALAIYQAAQKKLRNFSMLISHVLVPPAMEALLSSPNCRVQGFLAAGHVCAVMGYEEYFSIAKKYRVPIVVTGFEPLDILQGVLMTVQQLESGRAEVVRFARRHHAEAELASQPDGVVGTDIGDHLAEAIASIVKHAGAGFGDDFSGSGDIDVRRGDLFQIACEKMDAVRIDAPQAGLHQRSGDEDGVLRGDTRRAQDPDGPFAQPGRGNDRH